MQCIGVDISKQHLVTYDGDKQRVFPNEKDLLQFSKFMDHGKQLLVVFEPTSTYSRNLEELCRDKDILTVKLNPRLIPNLREVNSTRSKTDKTDAQLLYQYGVGRGEAEANISGDVDHLAQALSAHLVIYRVTQKARVAHQGVLEALSHDPSTPTELIDELTETIASLKDNEGEWVVRATKLIEQEEEATKSLQVLLTIPGVGPITAITLLAMFRRHPKTNRREIVALAGLDPVRHCSGSSVHNKSRISKRGNHEVRKRLYEATLSAARFNPAVHRIYHRLKERGKPEKVVRIAAARKLLLITHAIYKSGESYRTPTEQEG